jgi:hypothetical protein
MASDPHRSRPPQRVPSRRRSVYGLVNRVSRPSRLPAVSTQWHVDSPYSLTVAGAAPDSPIEDFTGFPFHPSPAWPTDS